MKTSRLLLLVLFVSCIGLSAQTVATIEATPRPRKTAYELGMSLDALTLRPGDYFSRYNTMLDNQVFSGVYLKCFRGQNALRFGLDYSQRSLYYGKRYGSVWNRCKSVELKAGYQRLLGKRKLAPYVFADLEFNHSLRQGAADYPGYFYLLYADYYYNGQYYTISSNTWSLSPGFGLRWNMGRSVVLNLESGIQLFYTKEFSTSFSSEHNASVGMNVRAFRLTLGFMF